MMSLKNMFDKSKKLKPIGIQTPEEQKENAPKEGSDPIDKPKTRTMWGDAWGRLSRNKLAIASIIWIIFMLSLIHI